ncbi:MAG TPA: GNAT family N-acetyltransferase [Myxococcota bacterium]|nr:GNAT family N-acetyltransferase [Myxococcota bacterium]
MHAQDDAVPFYEALGYRAEGEPFVQAGVLHRAMRAPMRRA